MWWLWRSVGCCGLPARFPIRAKALILSLILPWCCLLTVHIWFPLLIPPFVEGSGLAQGDSCSLGARSPHPARSRQVRNGSTSFPWHRTIQLLPLPSGAALTLICVSLKALIINCPQGKFFFRACLLGELETTKFSLKILLQCMRITMALKSRYS